MQAARRAPLNGDEHPEDEHSESPPDADPVEEDEASDVEDQQAPRRPLLFLIFAGFALAGLTLDQVTKRWAENSLEGRGTVEVFGQWLGWHLTYNSGASFSMGTNFTEVLSVIAICAVLVIGFLVRRLGSTGWAFGLGILLAGVAGNLTDRLFRDPGVLQGHVVDFIRLPNFPIFNVADICINIAAVLIIVQTIRGIRIDGTRHE